MAIQALIDKDPWLEPYKDKLEARQKAIVQTVVKILDGKSVQDFALGHLYFGLHRTSDAWVVREWAPYAKKMYIVGDFCGWKDEEAYALTKNDDGIWEGSFPLDTLKHGDTYKLHLFWRGGDGFRIPAYAKRVIQNDDKTFVAGVWHPDVPFTWQHETPVSSPTNPMIYEAHIGMSGEDEKVATYAEFTRDVLPRIKTAGYTIVQLMAIAEHPYYGSFGYHVSNYFAPSSRFGTPDDLKALIDTAHGMGLRVIIDIVHSHAVKNEEEGLSKFDGTLYQYFYKGARGTHKLWDSRTFDYGKPQVAHFLLSNLRYWLDEFHVDGFRFDGVTSMLYTHHGMDKAFTSYDDYFSEATDMDALAYLVMAAALTHGLRPDALMIAEDMSGMPGLAAPQVDGGIGFDYRLSMGVPDLWIKLLKEQKDEDWDLAGLLYDLTAHRPEEKVISYVESHDQALVGDKTIMFRLADEAMYWHMSANDTDPSVDRAMALHKIIRLLTATTHGGGYMNFMGNEFGHPEWVDFPREGNEWSYQYARRQWSLVDNLHLKYQWLANFDQALVERAKRLEGPIHYQYIHQDDHVMSFARDDYVVVTNLSPTESYQSYAIPAPGDMYEVALSSDDSIYGGQNRIDSVMRYWTVDGKLLLYLPARTAMILRRLE